jgi:hypothetical protein
MRGIGNIPIVFLSLCIFFSSSLSAQVKISLRNKAYFTVPDFKRIPEFFTGREFSGWKVYCRTNPADREGFYFVVKVTGGVPPLSAGCHWLLEWITPLDPTAQQKKVLLSEQKISGKEVFIGLTGSDWPDPSVQPIAWSLSLVDSEERILGQSQSFLWSK